MHSSGSHQQQLLNQSATNTTTSNSSPKKVSRLFSTFLYCLIFWSLICLLLLLLHCSGSEQISARFFAQLVVRPGCRIDHSGLVSFRCHRFAPQLVRHHSRRVGRDELLEHEHSHQRVGQLERRDLCSSVCQNQHDLAQPYDCEHRRGLLFYR